ncbi:MAG: hypothetical protein ACJA1N_000506, partial [Saprospiraceae bacterium]
HRFKDKFESIKDAFTIIENILMNGSGYHHNIDAIRIQYTAY